MTATWLTTIECPARVCAGFRIDFQRKRGDSNQHVYGRDRKGCYDVAHQFLLANRASRTVGYSACVQASVKWNRVQGSDLLSSFVSCVRVVAYRLLFAIQHVALTRHCSVRAFT